MNPQRPKTLGIYLLVVSTLQICLYLALLIPAEKVDWLYYFDPRLGIFFLESSVRGAELVTPGIFQWLSAVWILQLGVVLVSGRAWLKTYILSEIILSIPNILFFLAIVWANLSPAHGFSVRELLFPVMVMIAFSVIPVVLAFRAGQRANELNPARE